MKICVDLDGTLTKGDHSLVHYLQMKPDVDAIWKVNKKFEQDHVTIYTARPWIEYLRIKWWLKEHWVRYDKLVCGKLSADLYVDNNSKSIEEI